MLLVVSFECALEPAQARQDLIAVEQPIFRGDIIDDEKVALFLVSDLVDLVPMALGDVVEADESLVKSRGGRRAR